MLRKLLIAGALLLFAVPAQAAQILYDINFSGATGGAIPNVTGVDESTFLASSILGFRKGFGNLLPTSIQAGDTFTDYTAIQITGFKSGTGANLTPLTYGTGPGRTFEITILTSFSGVQLSTPTATVAGTYAVTSVDMFDVYFDFGAGFTGSDFFNLDTFKDTPLAGIVQTGVLGGPSGGTTNGPTAPDGTIDVIVKLTDVLHTYLPPNYFELMTSTGNPLDSVGKIVTQGIFDANNLATPPGTPLGGVKTGQTINGTLVTKGFDSVFSAFGLTGTQVGGAGATSARITSLSDNNGAFAFGFATRSDGSLRKAVNQIPEPASLAVFAALGVCAAGISRRRRKQS